jgi:N-methylhydantoinase B
LTRLRMGGSRTLSAPWGLAGGLPGGKGAFAYGPGVAPFQYGAGVLQEGQIVEILTPGSGGYGPPAERSLAAVRRDLAEGRITPDAARVIYPQLIQEDSTP